MVKLIVGLKGAGKTKQMIRDINEAVKNETGSMVCIENGTKLRYDIDRRVRLIEYQDYKMDGSMDFLKGFISGLYASNFDVNHIFIDSFYKLLDHASVADVEDFTLWCDKFGEANRVNFTVIVSEDPAKLPESLKKFLPTA